MQTMQKIKHQTLVTTAMTCQRYVYVHHLNFTHFHLPASSHSFKKNFFRSDRPIRLITFSSAFNRLQYRPLILTLFKFFRTLELDLALFDFLVVFGCFSVLFLTSIKSTASSFFNILKKASHRIHRVRVL
jgi:hypothetical protein